MTIDNDETQQNQPAQEMTPSIVVANKFTLTDPDGKERASLFIDEGHAMLAFYDKALTPRFLIAVQPDGSILMSAIHRTDDRRRLAEAVEHRDDADLVRHREIEAAEVHRTSAAHGWERGAARCNRHSRPHGTRQPPAIR